MSFRQAGRNVRRDNPTIRAISLLLTTALVLSVCSNMLQSFRSELPHPRLVLVDESGPNQELFGDLGHGSSRQTQNRRNHVESARPIGQDGKVLPFQWAETQVVNLFQQTSLLPMARA